ncbi:MAG: DUF4443 domain-containing protein [Candidatus Nanoarchaeia archaeon]|nr:DUF4443 domain-containing protein [Candidatus Nanoarchaeia archaeon]
MPGNKPNYSRIDVLRTLLLINKNTSRIELVKKLNLGEGTIRTILDSIKNKKLIVSTNKGHSLTKKGIDLIKKIESIIEIKNIKLNEIYPDMDKSVVLIKTKQEEEINFQQRDIAVRHGANGAIISEFNGKLVIPCPNMDFKKTYTEDYKKITSSFKFIKGNVLLICFAYRKSDAEKGALAISLNLSKELDNIFNKIC